MQVTSVLNSDWQETGSLGIEVLLVALVMGRF